MNSNRAALLWCALAALDRHDPDSADDYLAISDQAALHHLPSRADLERTSSKGTPDHD